MPLCLILRWNFRDVSEPYIFLQMGHYNRDKSTKWSRINYLKRRRFFFFGLKRRTYAPDESNNWRFESACILAYKCSTLLDSSANTFSSLIKRLPDWYSSRGSVWVATWGEGYCNICSGRSPFNEICREASSGDCRWGRWLQIPCPDLEDCCWYRFLSLKSSFNCSEYNRIKIKQEPRCTHPTQLQSPHPLPTSLTVFPFQFPSHFMTLPSNG